MCHGTIGSGLIEIQSQLNQNSNTLYIADGVLIWNRCLYCNMHKVQNRRAGILTHFKSLRCGN